MHRKQLQFSNKKFYQVSVFFDWCLVHMSEFYSTRCLLFLSCLLAVIVLQEI